jgi:hypothetical protein
MRQMRHIAIHDLHYKIGHNAMWLCCGCAPPMKMLLTCLQNRSVRLYVRGTMTTAEAHSFGSIHWSLSPDLRLEPGGVALPAVAPYFPQPRLNRWLRITYLMFIVSLFRLIVNQSHQSFSAMYDMSDILYVCNTLIFTLWNMHQKMPPPSSIVWLVRWLIFIIIEVVTSHNYYNNLTHITISNS